MGIFLAIVYTGLWYWGVVSTPYDWIFFFIFLLIGSSVERASE